MDLAGEEMLISSPDELVNRPWFEPLGSSKE